MLNIEADSNCYGKTPMLKRGLHVAVAVIVKDDRILISKRAQNVHQGGLWEFPGGKVETGETISEALFREIKEELGINIKKSHPLIKLVYHYPDKTVLLEARIVTAFDGKEYVHDSVSSVSPEQEKKQEQFGLEGQQVVWEALEQLEKYQFPQANKAIINALNLPQSYLITPDCELDSNSIKQFIEQFSNSIEYHNLRLVQLRIPSLFANKEPDKLIQVLCEIAQKNNVRVLANSSMINLNRLKSTRSQLDIMELTAGIHLTSLHLHEPFLCEDGLYKDGFMKNYRQRFPQKKIAASCHGIKDIERANQLGLDFIVISPVQHTASHPDQKPLGWEQFSALTDMAEMPVFALGGMGLNDIAQAQKNGAQGISAISSLWNAV